MMDFVELEAIEEARREKAFDRVINNGLENRSDSWQRVNFGAATVSYCSMDTIFETMTYTLIGERYE